MSHSNQQTDDEKDHILFCRTKTHCFVDHESNDESSAETSKSPKVENVHVNFCEPTENI